MSESGDECHHNLKGLSEQDARKQIINIQIDQFFLCVNEEHHRRMTEEDISLLL